MPCCKFFLLLHYPGFDEDPMFFSKSTLLQYHLSTLGLALMSLPQLLTCALGSLAKPFSTSLYNSSLLATTSTSSPSTDPNAPTSLTTTAYDLQLSAYYYSLARKRIGLLGSTIIRSQCYLLSGVYLMYALRPLEAWHNFVQASTTYYTYLQGRMRSAASHGGDGVQVSRTRRLEQRLYWSCFKSEWYIPIHV